MGNPLFSTPTHSQPPTHTQSTVKRRVETGTQGKDDVDPQWIPEGAMPGSTSESL